MGCKLIRGLRFFTYFFVPHAQLINFFVPDVAPINFFVPDAALIQERFLIKGAALI